MTLNEQQIELRTGGIHTTLKDYLDRRRIIDDSILVPVNIEKETAVLNFNPSKIIAVGVDTKCYNFEVICSTIPEIGLPSTSHLLNDNSKPLNLTHVYNKDTIGLFQYKGEIIYGLTQTNAKDGELSNDNNFQISFVNSNFELIKIKGNILLEYNLIASERYIKDLDIVENKHQRKTIYDNSSIAKPYKFKVLKNINKTTNIDINNSDSITKIELTNLDDINIVLYNGLEIEDCDYSISGSLIDFSFPLYEKDMITCIK